MSYLLILLSLTFSHASSPLRPVMEKREMSIISHKHNLEVSIKTSLLDKDVLEKEVNQKCISLDLECEIISQEKNLNYIIKVKTLNNEKNYFLDLVN